MLLRNKAGYTDPLLSIQQNYNPLLAGQQQTIPNMNQVIAGGVNQGSGASVTGVQTSIMPNTLIPASPYLPAAPKMTVTGVTQPATQPLLSSANLASDKTKIVHDKLYFKAGGNPAEAGWYVQGDLVYDATGQPRRRATEDDIRRVNQTVVTGYEAPSVASTESNPHPDVIDKDGNILVWVEDGSVYGGHYENSGVNINEPAGPGVNPNLGDQRPIWLAEILKLPADTPWAHPQRTDALYKHDGTGRLFRYDKSAPNNDVGWIEIDPKTFEPRTTPADTGTGAGKTLRADIFGTPINIGGGVLVPPLPSKDNIEYGTLLGEWFRTVAAAYPNMDIATVLEKLGESEMAARYREQNAAPGGNPVVSGSNNVLSDAILRATSTTRNKDEIAALLNDAWARFEGMKTASADLTKARKYGESAYTELTGPGEDEKAAELLKLIDPTKWRETTDDLVTPDTSIGAFTLPGVSLTPEIERIKLLITAAQGAGSNLGDLTQAAAASPTAGGRGIENLRAQIQDIVTDASEASVTTQQGVKDLNTASQDALIDILNNKLGGIQTDLFDQLYTAAMRPHQEEMERQKQMLAESAQNRGVYYSGYLTKDNDYLVKKLAEISADTGANLALESEKLANERLMQALTGSSNLSQLMGEQARARGAEEISRAGLGADFLQQREGTKLATEEENRLREALRLSGITTAGDLATQAGQLSLSGQQANINRLIEEALEMGRRRGEIRENVGLQQTALSGEQEAELAKAEALRQVAETGIGRSRALTELAGITGQQEIAAGELASREQQRIDDYLQDLLGRELGYNIEETGLIGDEYQREWNRRFQEFNTRFDNDYKLSAQDAAAVNAAFQAFGMPPATANTTWGYYMQMMMNSLDASMLQNREAAGSIY